MKISLDHIDLALDQAKELAQSGSSGDQLIVPIINPTGQEVGGITITHYGNRMSLMAKPIGCDPKRIGNGATLPINDLLAGTGPAIAAVKMSLFQTPLPDTPPDKGVYTS